jgi:mevalonate kinase
MVTFQAYIDNIFEKTGKKPADFLKEAKKAGMFNEDVKVMQIVTWLKENYGLGHGHAMAIVQTFKNAGAISSKK